MGMEEKDHIRLRCIIEVLGKPKEHVEKTIKQYIEKIKEDPDLVVLKEDLAETKKQGETMWSSFVELEMVIKGITKLVGFCFDYMPSSIDIIKPEEITFKSTSLAELINDLQARLHNLDMHLKKSNAENIFLRKNLNMSLKNVITVILAVKGKLDILSLSKLAGIEEKELKKFLDKLIEDNTIKLSEGFYSLK